MFQLDFTGLLYRSRRGAKLSAAMEEMFAAPVERLSHAPIEFGKPRRTPYLLVALVAFSGMGLYMTETACGLGAGFAIWCAVAAALLLKPPSKLMLELGGVRILSRDGEVFCPWQVFATDGAPFFQHDELVIPLHRIAIPQIQQWREGTLVAEGVDVKTRDFRIRDNHDGILKYNFEIHPETLAGALMFLACSLRDNPVAAKLTTRFNVLPSDDGYASIDEMGWLHVSQSRLVFPCVCSICGQPTDALMQVVAQHRFAGIHPMYEVELPIPTCATCQRQYRAARRFGRMVGMGTVLAIAGIAGAMIWHFAAIDPDAIIPAMILIAALLAAPCWRIGQSLFIPFRVRFNAFRHVISIRFTNPDVAEAVLATVRQAEI